MTSPQRRACGWQRTTARVSQGPPGPRTAACGQPGRAGVLERLKTRASRMLGGRDTAEAGQGGAWTEGLQRVLGGFCQLNNDLYPEGWRFVKGEEPRSPAHGGGVWRQCGLGRPGCRPHLSLGFGVLRTLSVSSISGPLSLGLYISRLSYSSSKSSSTSRICSRDTCSSPKPTCGRRQNL